MFRILNPDQSKRNKNLKDSRKRKLCRGEAINGHPTLVVFLCDCPMPVQRWSLWSTSAIDRLLSQTGFTSSYRQTTTTRRLTGDAEMKFEEGHRCCKAQHCETKVQNIVLLCYLITFYWQISRYVCIITFQFKNINLLVCLSLSLCILSTTLRIP